MNLSYRTNANALAISKMYNKPLENKDWFKIVSLKNEGEGESEILLFDYIGWPFNEPREFINALNSMGDVVIRINSPGGDVFDGAAISNAISSHKGNVTIRIEGLAASIASVIAMSGKTVQAYDNTMMMIHCAWTIAIGNQYEMSDVVDLLSKIDETIVLAYCKKTKKSKKEISSLMKDTTWFTAKEAKNFGLIDEIVSGKSVKNEFDLGIFGELPDNILNQGKTIRDKEKALREVGFSDKEAKTILARWKGGTLDEREVNPEDKANKEIKKDNSEIIQLLNKRTSLFT